MTLSRTIRAALALALTLAVGAAAQNLGQFTGEVRDMEGKPYPDVIIDMKHDETGQTLQVKTDKNGRFIQVGVRPGIYTWTFKVKDQTITGYTIKVQMTAGAEKHVPINFKEEAARARAENVEATKKQEEEKKQFDTMKSRFDAGRVALDQARQIRGQIPRTPADQRPALQQKFAEISQTAVTEFQEAEKASTPQEPNLHVILFNLGEAYSAAGRHEEAVAAYEKAIARKPTEPGYYNNLGNTLGTLGKIPEAGAAYEKAAQLDPANAASYWRNFGIVLVNANKLKEAVEPLRKATEIDPKAAESWFLLGRALLGAMEYKTEGDRITYVIQPGTVEAYQKYLELAPSGPYAQEAKDSLAQLELLGAGVQTKLKATKKKG